MRPRRRPAIRLLANVLVLGAIAAVAWYVVRPSSTAEHRVEGSEPASWQGLVGDAHPAVSLAGRMIVVLETPSVAQRLARVKYASEASERRWAAEDFAAQQQVLIQLARHGLSVRPDYSYARVLDGFSATLVPGAVALLEHNPEVAGVYPVRAAYPATISTATLDNAVGSSVGIPGLDGTGISIALLDTGVDLKQPYLGGRAEPGIDVVSGSSDASAQHDPQAPKRVERHGTELAGLLVGEGGPDGIQGVAPGATLLPIRVAGWQPAANGRDAVYGRSDQLIAGLERAVDPNGDGDTHDAVRIALIGETEPFASFPDSPESRAVAGALALDVLVVAPAGNDGDVGPLYGSIGGPAGSPAALAVGTTDPRVSTSAVRVVLTQGLNVFDDSELPLLDATLPGQAFEAPVGVPGDPGALRGKVALVAAGRSPTATVTAAIADGAVAVLLYGRALPPGSLGGFGVPIAELPVSAAGATRAAIRRRFSVEAAFGNAAEQPNRAAGHVASFSSRGLSFGGLLEPQVSAPGIGVPTSDPGASADGEPAFVSVTGTSVSAAEVAGAAALVAQERPGLSATDLASLVTGSARQSGGATTASAAGILDPGASAVGELSASATSLAFGPWSGPHWRETQRVVIRNVSTRRLTVTLAASSSLLTAVPDHVVLEPGAQRTVKVRARASTRPVLPVVTGILAIRPAGSPALRIPWAIAFRPPHAPLVRQVRLDPPEFTPSDKKPAVLQVVAGRIVGTATTEIEPVDRLDVLLYTSYGKFLGVLAQVRDLLPGDYSFGITGRGPTGDVLEPGSYELRIVAWPVLGKTPSRRQISFRIQ
jgi:subtilisin family serine protease